MRLILICICSVFFIHCGEFEVLDYNKQVRKSADSLYRIERSQYQKISDSICDLKFDEFRQLAIDTLKQSTLEEIEKLIKEQ